MSKPYDFYQSSLTGIPPTGGSFSEFYTPTGMFNAPEGYIFGFEDDLTTFKTVSINITGGLETTNLHVSTNSTNFSGSFSPVISETGATTSVIFTGNLEKDNFDLPTNSIFFTGNLEQDNLDTPTFTSSFTGSFLKQAVETYSLQSSFTGEISSFLMDTPSYSVGFSGNFVKTDRDNVSLNVTVNEITWGEGNPKITGDFTENSEISFGISFIQWTFVG